MIPRDTWARPLTSFHPRLREVVLHPMLKHNAFFDGKIQSIGFERQGRRMTAGVIDSGEFHFDTKVPERMTVISGELAVRTTETKEWRRYPSGTAFEVAANSGFDVKAEAPCAYLCEFLA